MAAAVRMAEGNASRDTKSGSGPVNSARVQVAYRSQDLVYPSQLPATLYCVRDCPTAASMSAFFSGAPIDSPFAGLSANNFQATLLGNVNGVPFGLHTDGFNRGGGFVGGGVENSLNFFGMSAPGWFMKTEYRLAYLGNKALSERVDGTNILNNREINFKPLVQTIQTSLVYRFNWGSPVRY